MAPRPPEEANSGVHVTCTYQPNNQALFVRYGVIAGGEENSLDFMFPSLIPVYMPYAICHSTYGGASPDPV